MPPYPLLEPIERAASLDPVESSGLSISIPLLSAAPLLCLRCRLEDSVMVRGIAAAPGPGADLGGAAAIGTTPFPPTAPVADPALPWKLVGLLTAVFAPDCPPLIGDSPEAFTLPARFVAGGVAAWLAEVLAVEETATVELFLRFVPELLVETLIEFFLPDLVLVPAGKLLPDPRLRFLMTSVFKLRGRTTPWSFRNRPQALQRG